MSKVLLAQVLRVVLPALLGAVGAFLATAYPAVYSAVCVGGV